ncbi:transglutaminase-like domain-containing protein, partial [Paenibacillus sp. HB172176]|uniref:transglutaminase-like domain-containing protein n=1 Tax=Paenibacillus sp. HB172176 TaxID=2493690 RepID=UPI00143BD8F2
MRFLPNAVSRSDEQSGQEGHEETFAYRLATSLLLFGLLAEWLMPWVGSGDWAVIYHPAPLLAIIASIMAAGLFKLPWPLLTATHAAIILLSLMWLFKSGDESGVQWLIAFPELLWNQIRLMLQNGLWAMSAELRTLLLFAGWAMLAPALQSILWLRQVVFSIVALTIVYLLALHIWMGMDVLNNLLRTSAEGFLLGVIVAVPRVRRLLQVNGGGRRDGQSFQASWLAGALFLMFIIVGAGMLASAGKESDMSPPSWTTSMTKRFQQSMEALGKESGSFSAMNASKLGELSSGLTGYGFDDSELGGPIADDDTLLFKALSPVAAYWRGEAKTIYDGRGWSNGDTKLTLLPVNSDYDESAEVYSANRDQQAAVGGSSGLPRGQLVEQTVVWSKEMSSMPIFASGYDGQVSELIAADPRRKLGSYLVNGGLGAMYAPSETAKLERYKVQSRLPVTEPEKLGEADEAVSAMSAEDRFALATAMEPYLQLPAELPERVFALASEIGGGGVTSQYDRVKAVEEFLKDSYTYTKQDVAVPAAGEDFVDDFLFNQKQGYCVHFSSAMVVLLRAQGIPARWVKGFTSGELAEQQGGSSGSGPEAAGNALYEVRGSDAHAWVEVYFPGAGWAPFDPTPGFDGVDLALAASGGVGGGEAAAAETGAAAAVGDGKLSLARLAAGFEAGAERAASGAARGAHALAQAARSAVGAAAASPAASAAAGGAALAL